ARRFDGISCSDIDYSTFDCDVEVSLRPSQPDDPADEARAPGDKSERAANQAYSAYGHLTK
ncbi:MAG TPA: hypothetical protein VGR40_07265, partial [Candidatus Binatus sp.]|nr:hypothetical protein [Candidatus Binatus sp.]